jgi:hypothetical protein
MNYGISAQDSFPGENKDFFILSPVQTGSRAHLTPSPEGTWRWDYSDRGVKLFTSL